MKFISGFTRSERGNAALTFCVLAPVLVAIAFASINVAMTTVQRNTVQSFLDSAALASAKLFLTPGATEDSVRSAAQSWMDAQTGNNLPPDIGKSAINVDLAQQSIQLEYTGDVRGTLASTLWNGIVHLDVNSGATVATVRDPVCILITEPTAKHTFRASNASQVNVDHCLIQVDTANWDAVEAGDTAYIHTTNGQNCFVGDIHFGDITQKSDHCTFFPDPFKSIAVSQNLGCTVTNKVISTPASLSPGVYCGGLTLKASTTFQPGVYYLKDGDLAISGGSTDVTANDVTFVLVGKGAAVNITGGHNLKFTASSPDTGGAYSGFIFFLDPASVDTAAATSTVKSASITGSGAIYLAGQQLIVGSGASLVMNPGSIVADYLLPQGGNLTLTGTTDASTAALGGLRKPRDGGALRLFR